MRRFFMFLMLPLLALTLSSCATAPDMEENHTVYFEFGSAQLTPDAKMKLDMLANRLKSDSSIDAVQIVGYADHIGKPENNEMLSKRRAMVVKHYLEWHGYHAISMGATRWVGETRSEGDCGMGHANRQRIACLAPDRKVEIVFMGEHYYCKHNDSRHCTQRPEYMRPEYMRSE